MDHNLSNIMENTPTSAINGHTNDTVYGLSNGNAHSTTNGITNGTDKMSIDQATNGFTNGVDQKLPVIIIGAGMAGLTLAQALKKAEVPFEIYDRDSAEDTEKGHGWALTVHWALPAFEQCLPPALFNRLDMIQVDPEQAVKDTGRFPFLNLKTGDAKFVIPPNKRMRINRKLLRTMLAEGIDIRYGKTMDSFVVHSDGLSGVEVHFTDGTSTKGSLLVGTDGRSSKTRRLLVGEEEGKLRDIPVRSVGVTTVMNAQEIAPLLSIDPLLFQGSHPDTGVYQWFSLVSSPLVNGSISTPSPYWVGQLIQSWICKSEDDIVPTSNEARLAIIKRNGEQFEPRLRDTLAALPLDTKCQEVKWGDWTPRIWPNHGGRVTLVGDSAHSMTSYRGEAFNHAITDAAELSKCLISAWKFHDELNTIASGVTKYETEMRARTYDAVLLSTQACLEAHDLNALHADSPCVSKRAKVAKDVMPPAREPLDIAIVGGGIVGLVLTAGLLRQGVKVKVYEQARSFRELGVGIAFTANAIKCMENIDPAIVAALRSSGSNATSSNEDDPNDYLRWLDGCNQRSQDDPFYEKMLYIMGSGRFEGCRRDQFLEALAKLIPSDVIEFSKRLDKIEEKGVEEKVKLEFVDGTSAYADAVIGTDGIKSRVRQALLGKDNPASYPHYSHKVAFRALIPIDKAVATMGEYKAMNQHYHVGPGAHLIHYPVANRTLINCTAFLSDPNNWQNDKQMVVSGSRKEVEDAISGWNPCAQALVNLMPEEMDKWAVFDHWDYPAPQYSSGKICLAGDAAHASSPHHGAGACIGIEDALCLCTLMREILSKDASLSLSRGQSLITAFQVFNAIRRPRSQWLVNSSRRVCDFYHQPEWADESKWVKAETCFEEIQDRNYKIWHFDFEGMMEKAVQDFEQRHATLGKVNGTAVN